MSVAGSLAAGRVRAASLMQDTAVARRKTGKSARDPDTGLSQPTYATLFTTRCKVTGGSQASSDVVPRVVSVGGVERVVYSGGLHLPIPAAGSPAADLRAGDRIEITAIGPMTDPSVLGKVYEVVGFGGKSWATARRLDVVEVD